ncbi:membrane protein [Novosphingobium sediminis]|uniref:Membrane protein n=1 Tax=Novosphingobium sediminis TaxID=707214 RepID=A0A512AN12_9SPHN|nr:nuclear transport factor 2 family protein [Novosphingobium sediminis]GEO01103.1 membrane protein [Novosphingobium sediminis]
MKMLGRIAACLAVAAFLAAPLSAKPAPSLTERNRAIITDFAHLFYDKRDVRAAFAKYVAPDYIQHNANILDGRDAAIAALEPMFRQEGSRFEIKRIVVDGDMAVVHLHGRAGAAGNGGTVADIYRLKGGKIVEHWDILQPIADKPLNSHAYF